jgi:hypothetical protein
MAVFAAASLGSWVMVHVLGLDTLGTSLDKHWQFLDLPYLLEHPLSSLLHQHAQPPLLNMLAVVAHALTGDVYQGFIVINSLANGLIAVVMVLLMRALGLPKPAAVVTSFLYLLSPASLLNTAYPFYPVVTAVGYAGLTLALVLRKRFPRRGLVLLVMSLVYLYNLRSSFPMVEALGFAGLYGYGLWRDGSTRNGSSSAQHAATAQAGFAQVAPLIKPALLVLALGLLAVPVKNAWLYGTFSHSSWGPLNLAKAVGIPLKAPYFPTPEQLSAAYPDVQCAVHHGYQDTVLRKRNGEPNFNSCLFLAYADMVKPLVWERYEWRTHGERMLLNAHRYLKPPDQYSGLQNQYAIDGYRHVFNKFFMTGPGPGFPSADQSHVIRWALVLIMVGSLVRWGIRRDISGVLLLVAGLHMVAHIVSDGAEGPRFVFDIEFLWFVLGFKLLCELGSWAVKVSWRDVVGRGIRRLEARG